jgi:hypothetical protein
MFDAIVWCCPDVKVIFFVKNNITDLLIPSCIANADHGGLSDAVAEVVINQQRGVWGQVLNHSLQLGSSILELDYKSLELQSCKTIPKLHKTQCWCRRTLSAVYAKLPSTGGHERDREKERIIVPEQTSEVVVKHFFRDMHVRLEQPHGICCSYCCWHHHHHGGAGCSDVMIIILG